VFNKTKSETGIPIKLPCGKCQGCYENQARQWALRCMHEKRMHPKSDSAFVTLTYSDDNLPPGNLLCKRDLQLFMKNLRHEYPAGLRFFACGEYGDNTRRPHYHLLMLNEGFPDKKFAKMSAAGERLYTSARLGEIWGLGNTWVGDVTYASCAYVTRYVTKKLKGVRETAEVTTSDGEVLPYVREFVCMSRRPGIGSAYFDRHAVELLAHDSVISNGKETSIPTYYQNKMKLLDPVRLEKLKRRRRKLAILNKSDNTLRRLRVRELVADAKRRIFRRGVL